MKKIFSLLMVALFSATMFAATETTVYYAVSAETVGTYTVKLNVNFKGDAEDWHNFVMTKADFTYEALDVYKAEFTDAYDGLGCLQFQLYDGEEWKSEIKVIDWSWTSASVYNGKMWIHGGTKWVDPFNKFYVTGDSAFVYDAGSEAGKWNPKAIASEKDTLVLNLKAGQEYRFKVLPKGDWSSVKGFSELTEKPAGLLPDKDYNISFALATAGEVKIVYTDALFKVIGDLAVETLKLVPGVAAADNAKFAVWNWEEEGVWSAFFAGEGDTLSAEIAAIADSVIFARFKPETEAPDWNDNIWNNTGHKLIDHEGLTFTVTSVFDGTWEEVVPEVPAKFYITGSANLVGGSGWVGNDVKSTEDSYIFEKLAAGKYQLKVTEDGTWGTVKGIDEMSEVAAGLYCDQDKNVCFILSEEGDVKVTYKKGEESTEFTVEGAFVAPEIKLIGIKGWTEATDAIALEVAEDKKSASKTLELDGNWYDFKVIRADEWVGKPNAGDDNYKIHRGFNWVDGLERGESVKAISLQPDVKGEYTFTYDFAAGKLTVAFPDPVLVNGFYLIGKIGGEAPAEWNYDALKAEHLFVKNAEAEGEEYALEVTLEKDDEFKVVRCDYDQLGTWYPAGEEKNYKVDADHAGEVTVYFRPNGDGVGEGWHEGVIYVASNGGGTGVENTAATVKAVKSIENGMLIINKNGVRYTVLGQSMK